MRAEEWAGWLVIAAFVVFVVTILGAGWYVGAQLGASLAHLFPAVTR